jgi:hypothetical protein
MYYVYTALVMKLLDGVGQTADEREVPSRRAKS